MNSEYQPRTENRRVFSSLDMLRGVASLSVAQRHMPDFFGNFSLYSSYLAVDLFFLLSGFVLAHSYEHRIIEGQLTAKNFMRMRFIRLFPFMWIAIIIVILTDFAKGSIRWGEYPLAFLFLPTPWSATTLWLVGPSWSLTFELFINATYHRILSTLNERNLFFIIISAFVLLSLCSIKFGSLDGGYTITTLPTGVARILFSFFLGIFIFRMSFISIKCHSSFPFLGTFVMLALFSVNAGEWQFAFDLAVVSLFFPSLLFISTSNEIFGTLKKAFSFLGSASYPLYILHSPIAWSIRTMWAHFMNSPFLINFGLGSIVLLALVGICGLLETYIERPFRKSLQSHLLRGDIKTASQPR